MTFFLPETAEPTVPEGFVSKAPVGLWEGIGAATSQMMRDTNASWLREREVGTERARLAQEAWERMGKPDMGLVGGPKGVRFKALETEQGQNLILERARAAAESDPEAWKDFDPSVEGIESRVTDKRKAEDKAETELLDMMPSGRGTAELVGGVVGATADVRQIPFLLAGGGSGSILKILGREALMGAASEGVTLPDQFQTAKELDKADPNILQQLAFGAVGGAALAGLFEGVARGISHYRNRQRMPDTKDPIRDAMAVDAAEEALMSGDDMFDAIDRAVRDIPEEPDPLIRWPEEWDDPNVTASQAADPDALPIETAPAVDMTPDQGLIDDLMAALGEARKRDNPDKKPLISSLVRSSKSSAPGFPTKQIHPEGQFAAELRAAGVTNKTHPGLFSKRGSKDLDTLVASELEEAFPGIREATGTAPDATYLDRQGLLNVVIRDATGDSSWLRSRADVMKMERQLSEAQSGRLRNTTPQDDFIKGYEARNGMMVAKDEPFDLVAARFDEWAADRGYSLLPTERDEVIATLQKRGGDAEYLVERVFERGIDDAKFNEYRREQKFSRETLGGQTGRGGTNPPEPGPARQPSAGNDPAEGWLPELAREEAVRTSGRIYDDVTSSEAQSFFDSQISDLRARVEAGDDVSLGYDAGDGFVGIKADDGRSLNSLSDVLAELDELDQMARELKACQIGGEA